MFRNLIRQIILEAFDFDYNKSYVPPTDVSNSAGKALNIVDQNDLTEKGTNSGSGINKAKDLLNKKAHNHNMIRRLKSYFDNNKSAFDSEINSGKNINNSGIIQSWELHGGNQCYTWVSQIMNTFHQSNLNTKKNIRKAGGAGENKGMGTFDTTMMDTTKGRTKR